MDKYRGNLTRDVQEERAARGLPPAAHEAIDNIKQHPVPKRRQRPYRPTTMAEPEGARTYLYTPEPKDLREFDRSHGVRYRQGLGKINE